MAPTKHTAVRPDYFRTSFEPLEDRKLLSVSQVWVDDNWTDVTHATGPLTVGDTVVNSFPGSDISFHGLISGSYGSTAFGTVMINGTPTTAGGFGTIRSAINPAIVSVGGTLSILEGTYTESDIIINTPLQMMGNGMSGVSQTLIVPEVASAQGGAADAEFGVGTHSGIILYSYSSTVTNLHLDGSGNAALNTSAGHDYNYHQGITTLYDLQAGGNYASLHNGSLVPIQINIPGGPAGNRSVPGLDIDGVTADNTYWHGLTLSALANHSFGTQALINGAKINISNSKVNNVGPSGSQDLNRVGILLQNLDNSPTQGNASFDIVSNAGVGIKLDAFGANRVIGSASGARNRGSLAYNTVNNAVVRGLDLEFWDHTDVASQNTVNNVAGSNSAVGIYINHGEMLMLADTVNGSLIGLQVQNTSHNVDPGTTITPFPTFAASFVLNGPGTTVAGSIGILGENSSAEPNATSFGLGFEAFAAGYETGVKLNQAVVSPNGEQSLVIADRLNVSGNKTGFNLGNNVLLQGSWSSNDPVVVTGSATYDPGFVPFNNYALGVPTSNGHKIQRIQTSANTGPTGGTFTVSYNGQTTSPVAWNVTAAGMQTALNALGNVVAVGGATVTGGGNGLAAPNGGTTNSWDVSFGGAGPTFFALVMNGAGLTGATNLLVTDIAAVQNNPPAGGVPNTLPRINPPTPPISTADPPNAGVIGSGSLTLASTAHYKAQLSQAAGTLPFQDFNNPVNWAAYSSSESNPWRNGYIPTGTSQTWCGNVTQDGTGTLVINPLGATDLGSVYASGGVPWDVTGYDTLQIVARKVAGNTSDLVLAILSDIDGTSYEYPLPMRLLNTATFSTLTVNLNAPAYSANSADGVFNLSKITGWGFIGDGGSTHGDIPNQVQVGMQVDRMEFTRPNGNDQLQVTSVNLAGATLDGSLAFGYSPTIGQVFRIVDNTGVSTVTGTFSGLPQGAVTTLFNPFDSGGNVNPNSTTAYKFKISYTGGTGNDVVLTRVADIAPAVTTGNTATWAGRAVAIAPAGTVTDADDTQLTSMTVSFSGGHDANDVLALASPPAGITADYNSGTGVLALSGVASVASYQTALQNVTYQNTTPNFAHADETLNTVAFDFETNSATAVSKIHVGESPPILGALNIYYRHSFYDNPSNDPGNLNDDTAIATDKTAYLPGSGTSGFANYTTYDKGINGLMVDFLPGGNHASIKAADFSFKMSAQGFSGQSSDPSDGTWATPVPTPTVVFRAKGTVVPAQLGYAGNVLPNDRIELIWADNRIVDRWLEVIVKATANTGLAAQSVFFFGNMPGDTNDDPNGDFKNIDANDQFNVKIAATDPNNTGLYFSYPLSGAISNLWDINRDGAVNANDQLAAKIKSVAPYGELDTINIGPGGPFAPVGGSAAVASALYVTSNGSSSGPVSSCLTNSLSGASSVDLPANSYFAQLGEIDSPLENSTTNDAADELGLDDELLATLAGGLSVA